MCYNVILTALDEGRDYNIIVQGLSCDILMQLKTFVRRAAFVEKS